MKHQVSRMEEWRVVAESEGRYEVSSCGRVRSYSKRGRGGGLQTSPRFLAQTIVNGYILHHLVIGGRHPNRYAHRLVAVAFLGESDLPTPDVNHIDGNRSHNFVGNLEWVTRSQNVRHAIDVLERNFGTSPRPNAARGENHNRAKLTARQVREIRDLIDSRAIPQTAIAHKYGVSQTVISCIARRKTWRHLW